MATLASLTVNLLAQTGRFTQPIQQAARTVERFDRQAERMQNTLRQVEGATSAARSRLLAMSAAVAVATKQATAYAGAITAVHQQTGLAIESVQGLRFAAEQSNTDIATLEKGLRSFVRRAAEASQGNASFAKGFERLGVNVRDASGALKDVETILMEVADGAAAMASEADASAALMLVMGDAGRRLVPFMRQGSEGIRDLMDQAVRLGIVADEQAVLALANLGDELAATGNRFGAISRDIAYRFSPAIQVGLGWVNRLIDGFFDLSAEQRQQIVRWTAIVGAVLGGVAVIGVLARVLSGAIGVMRTFGTVLQFVFSPLVLYTALAIGALALFKTAWDGDWLEIQTRTRAAVNYINEQLDRLLDWWETSDIGQAVRTWWDKVVAIWESDELTLPEKIVETLNLVPGVNSLLRFVERVQEIWRDEDLTFGEKLVEIARITPGVRWVVDFVENVQTIWADEDLTLREKVAEIARLIPGALWFEGFLADVRSVWQNEELTLPAKLVEIARLIPGVSAIERMIDEIRTIWSNEDLTLGEKFVGSFKVISDIIELEAGGLAFLFGAAVTAPYILDALGTAIRTIPGLLALTEGGNLLRLTVAGMALALGVASWKFFNASPEAREEILQSIERIIDDIFPDGFEGFAEDAKAILWFAVEPAGELFDAIKHGLNTGDWSQVFGAAADVWRSGVTLYVSLQLAAMAVQEVLSMMAIGFGFPAVRQLGPGAVLGTISVGVALVEAYETGHYRKFGEDLVAALAAGLIAGGLTRSPQAGMLAFTLVLNLQLGSTIGDWFRGDEVQNEIDALQERADNLLWALDRQPRPFSSSVVGPLFDELDEINRRLDELGATPVEIPFPRITLAPVEPVEISAVLTIEDVVGIRGIDDILDAIYVAEGGPAARVPYGATGFADAGHQFAKAANQQLFDELVRTLDLVEGTDEYYRAAAAVTVKHYWDTFARDFPEVADKTFSELAPDVQAAFIRHLGRFYAPLEHSPLNQNWTPNVLKGLGLAGFARGGYTGNAPVDKVVGVVHGQELVIPAPAVRRGLEGILEWLGVPGFQSGTPVMIDSGLGYAVSPGTTSIDVGFLRAQFETAMRWIEQSISPELADTLRQSFEGLLDVTDMLERELKLLWEAIDSVPEALDDALASARDFGDELDELLASEQERQDRLQRIANNVNAALSGFASGLGESQQLLARFIQTLRYDAESGFGFDTASLIQMGASVLGWLFGGQGQQARREARQFAAPDPLGMGGLLAARAEQQRLEAMIPSLERAVKNAQGFVDHMAGQWWNPSQQHRAAEALRVASEELSSAQQALAAFDFRAHLGIDAPSIARAVESGLDLADTTRLGASLESTIRDALTRAWVASDEMLRLQNRFGDMLERIVTEYMETGIVGDLGELRAVIAAIEERGEAFADVLRELGLAADDVTDSLGGMLNIPRGFKYALERVEAATARPVPANVTPAPVATVHPRTSPDVYAGAGLSSGSSERPIIIQGDVYGWDDFKRKVQQASDEAKRDGSLASYGFAGGGS